MKPVLVWHCIGCHRDVPAGELRSVRPAHPYADDPCQNREAGASNLCLDCHSGTASGTSIGAQLARQADFGNLGFIAPHYLTAGGVLQGSAGYRLPGSAAFNFYTSNSHRGIGSGNRNHTGGAGSCIACHKSADSGHSFQAGAGELCVNCHGASLTPAALSQQKAGFASGLAILNRLLADKGHAWDPASSTFPYFSETNWGSGQVAADTMGAAFNYALLAPGRLCP